MDKSFAVLEPQKMPNLRIRPEKFLASFFLNEDG